MKNPEKNEKLFAFLRPVVERELQELCRTTDLAFPDAVRMAQGLLISRLQDLTEPVVQAELEETLRRINPAVQLSPHFASAEDRKQAVRETEKRLAEPGESPFGKYPLLKRDAGIICRNFRSFFNLFLRRLAENSEKISQELLRGRAIGKFLSVSASGADAHLHGQTALRVACEGGVFYYKPRDSRIDRLYARIVERFCPEDTLAPKVVCGEGCGFLECMHVSPVACEEEIALYYERFGALTALFRFLGTTDMHFENILACGSCPAAIDLETLLTPVPDPFQGCTVSSFDDMNAVWKDILFSAQSTLVLPMMLQGKAQISPLLRGGTETARCLPSFQGKQIPVYGYEEDFLKGFSRMYDRLLASREDLFALVSEAKDMNARFVLRASAYYALTLREMHSPAGCASQAERERILADLEKHFEKKPEYLPAVRWEQACLREGDIPYFSFRAGNGDLSGDPRDEVLLPAYFQLPALERCREIMKHSGQEEKRFEMAYLRLRFLQGPDFAAASKEGKNTADLQEHVVPLSAQEAHAQALDILRALENLTLGLTDGSRILLSPDGHLVPSYHQTLERGLPGMSLFFSRFRSLASMSCPESALACAARFLSDTEDDLLRIRATYRQMPDASRRMLHPGLCEGVGGLLFSPCLDEAGIRDVTESLFLMQRSFAEENAGLSAGIGGLLLGCVRAYARLEEGEWKERFLALIERLGATLLSRMDTPEGASDFAQGMAVSGLAKGMAGIGLALVRAWEVTGNEACLEGAEKAFTRESSQYREVLGGWPDYGKAVLPVVPGEGLEAGAPGIALAAALCQRQVRAAEKIADKALSCTLALPLRETDDLAAGNAGIALALTVAAGIRRDPVLLKAAGERLAFLADRAEREGGYRLLPPRYRNSPDPSFWRGSAGIGYAMLVYADTWRAFMHE